MNQKRIKIILNLIITIFTLIGIVLMLTSEAEPGSLQARGIENFKFYTVLSNVLCGIVSSVYLALTVAGKNTDKLVFLKLSGLCGVTITFAVVAFFFGPVYGYAQFYKGGNLYYHLLEPVAALIEFLVIRRPRITIRQAAISAVPTFLYGCFYLMNILINGIGGPWPDTNDFYAFLNWGYPIGILIFFSITMLSFILALIFRKISNIRAVE